MQKTGQPVFSEAGAAALANYKRHVDRATRFIPVWGKVAVALALGCGTIVGWKRIVVTVGEKIGAHDAGGHDAVGRPLLGLPVNILRGGGHGRMLPIAPGRRVRG
jgi:hypothetical protein